MNGVPDTPSVETAPDALFSGHLWLTELIDGRPLRFQVQRSGLLRIGDANGVYADHDAIPLPLQRAVAHIRDSFDRKMLRTAVDDVESVTCFGVATTREATPYNLASMPPFLGTDVWTATDGGFRPPDAVAGIFRQLGLSPVNTFERETHARDFTAETYELPASAWYDGPAAGVVIRNKQGHRGKLSTDTTTSAASPTTLATPQPIDALIDEYVTSAQIDSIVAAVRSDGESATVDIVTDRLCAFVGRRQPAAFLGADRLDQPAFRSAVAEQVQRQLQA